jgi:hypothetical protein
MIEHYTICDRVVGERRVEHGVGRYRDGVVWQVVDGGVGRGNWGEGP